MSLQAGQSSASEGGQRPPYCRTEGLDERSSKRWRRHFRGVSARGMASYRDALVPEPAHHPEKVSGPCDS
jgi:hypothetical protein